MQTAQRTQQIIRMAMAFVLAAAVVVLAGIAAPASAQTPTVITIFNNAGITGPLPYGVMVQGRDGNLYSSTEFAGTHSNGGFFSVSPAGVENVPYDFLASDAGTCTSGVSLGSDGNFYGVCYSGGTGGQGIVYRVTSGGAFSILHPFTGTGTDGANPQAVPTQAVDGNFYGTTVLGGAHNLGTVYKLTLSGILTTIYSFTGASDGSQPGGLVQGSDGFLYGQGYKGGSGFGSTFKISTLGKLTALHTFVNTDGAQPTGTLIQGTDGNLYGTTYQGGTNNNGVVFKMATTGKITVLHNFLAATDGAGPQVALVQATDGNFYGICVFGGHSGGIGGNGLGSIFKMTAKGVFSTVYLFDNTTVGGNPAAGLVQHTDGLLYGDEFYGPSGGSYGGVYSLNIGAKPFLNLSATSGIVGSQVGIFGQGFSASSVVKFNGVAATAAVLTGTTYITATVPAGASTGLVTVTTGSTTLTSLKKYLVHNAWSAGASMPVALEFPATGLASGKIYVAGGLTTTAVASNQVYNPATNTWGTAAPLPVPTYGGGSAVVANVLYVFGGYLSGGTPTNAVWAYKPSTNTWTAKAALPTARGSSVAVVSGTSVYVIGGNGSTNRLNTVESYNTATNAWTTKANLLVGKSEPSAGLVGSTIVVADGYTAGGDNGDNEGYNTSTNTWSALAVDPTLRNASCSGSITGQLYVAGGWTNNPPPMTVTSAFSPTTHKWTTQAALPHAVGVPGSAVSGGLLYCIGGTDGTNVQNFVQIYQP